MLCGSTMGTVGCAGETEGAIEKPSIPPYFQLSAHFSRIIDGSWDVQLSGMKMSQSLGSRGRKRLQSGAERGRIHSAAIVYSKCRRMSTDWQCHCCQYCVSGSVVCCLLFWRRRENCMWLVYHQGYFSSLFFLHTCRTQPPPPPDLASRWKKKHKRLIPCHRGNWSTEAPWWNSCNIFMIRGRVPHSRDYWHRGTVKNGGTVS